MQPRRRKCVRPPPPPPKHFMKAILPSPIHENQLRIPDEFIARFWMELSTDDVITITVPDGRIWEMGLKKCGGNVFFCNNWPQFANYYSIRYGSYLVFKYEGNSKFSVIIFDSTSAEISYPRRNEIPPDADLASSRMSKSAASERAHAAANAFKPNNPYFVSILKPDRLYVPVEFASKYLKPKVPLKIQNSNGKKWEVTCILNYVGSVSMRMARGLAEFARGNDLSEGDTCVFELIKKRHQVLLQVTAFRAVDYAN